MIDRKLILENEHEVIELYKKRNFNIEPIISSFKMLNEKSLELKLKIELSNRITNLISKIYNPKITKEQYDLIRMQFKEAMIEFAEKHPQDLISLIDVFEKNRVEK